MKVCRKCGVPKPGGAFVSHRKTKDRLASWCRRCTTDSQRFRRNNKLVRRRREMVATSEKRRLIEDAKARGCANCDERHPVVIDLHHVHAGTKVFTIGWQGVGRTLEELKQEIAKCVALCSNCHRKFHAGVITIEGLPPPSKFHHTQETKDALSLRLRKPQHVDDFPHNPQTAVDGSPRRRKREPPHQRIAKRNAGHE